MMTHKQDEIDKSSLQAETKSAAQPPVLEAGRRTRFAPSPTGHLHLGHAYSALCAWHYAGKDASNFVLRIDDLDHTRCRPEYVDQIISDLSWLGISWEAEPVFQSQRLSTYADALETLQKQDLIYPCYLSRAEISDLLSAPHGPSTVMPSTRDTLDNQMRQAREEAGHIPAWRLDMQKALAVTGPIYWTDKFGDAHLARPEQFGDIVIARRDIQASYHLSVILDDYRDGIDLVVRGADLKNSTDLHRLLQILLDLPAPNYHHHHLICDETGKRLAKRDDARALSAYRKQQLSPQDILSLLPDIS